MLDECICPTLVRLDEQRHTAASTVLPVRRRNGVTTMHLEHLGVERRPGATGTARATYLLS